jgi:uncharacterized protein
MKTKINIIAVFAITALLFSCSSTSDKKGGKDDKIKEGPGKIFWDDGSVKGNGNYKNFQKDGKWTLFHKTTSEKLAEGNYLNDKQNGQWIYYYKNGAKNSEGAFEEDQKTGQWIGYYETNEKMWEARYVIRNSEFGKVGGIEGNKTTYYPSRNVKMEEEYVNGVKKGKHQEFYENGNPKEISWFTDNKHNGKCNVYWETGKPKEMGMYQDELRNGDWKIFYDNGQMQMSGSFIIGKMAVKKEEQQVSQRHGRWQFFSKEGLLQKEGDYEKNKEKGFWKFYSYKNNARQLRMELELTGGMATGKGKIYDNGALAAEGNMTGMVKGIFKKSVGGKEESEEVFIDAPADNPKANITYKWSGNWQLPKKNGPYTEYFAGGRSKKIEASYMMDKLSGKYKEYFLNGKIKAEGEYMNDKKNGIWNVYNEKGSLIEEESGRWMNGKKSKF